MIISYRLPLFVLITAAFPACGSSDDNSPPADGGHPQDGSPGGDGGTTDSGTGVTCSGPSRSFEQDVQPLIGNCGGEGTCHGGIVAGTWPYNSLVNKTISRDVDTCDPSTLIVASGHPEKSYLLNKLTGVGICSGVRMPKVGDYLRPEEIQIIADWICQGAPEN